MNFVTWYRKDWYRKAGIELFTNYEEYVQAMKLFMDLGYTNGKPILPKAPFSANFQVYGDSEWPRLEEEWVMYSDIAVAPLPSRGGYYSLKKQNNEYNLGLYSTEFELDAAGGTSASQATADFINGEAYSYNRITERPMKLKPLYLAASFESNTGDSILKAVNVQSTSVAAMIPCPASTVMVETLSADVMAENTFAHDNSIQPVMTQEHVNGEFVHTFPPYSVTILRFKKA